MLLAEFAIAKSCLPMPRKSPTATAIAVAFTEISLRAKNVPVLDLVTSNNTGTEVPPPGAGLVTVTTAVFAVAMKDDEMGAVNCWALTRVVARALPFHLITAPVAKPVPLTVRVNAAPPGVATVGLRG